jgi:hypothetical protein
VLDVQVDAVTWQAREPAEPDLARYQVGLGRELFAGMRGLAGAAEDGAMIFGDALTFGDARRASAADKPPRGRDQPRVTVMALED